MNNMMELVDELIGDLKAAALLAMRNPYSVNGRNESEITIRNTYSKLQDIADRHDRLLKGLNDIFNKIATCTDPKYIRLTVLDDLSKLLNECEGKDG